MSTPPGYSPRCPSKGGIRTILDEAIRLTLHLITKLRCDADCRFLYPGPHPKRRGARHKYAGKVNFQDLRRFASLGTLAAADHLHLYTSVVWHVTLKRQLRLVVVVNRKTPAKPRYMALQEHLQDNATCAITWSLLLEGQQGLLRICACLPATGV